MRSDSVGHSLRLYTLTELGKMLNADEAYALDSVRMMAVISR